MPAHGGLDPDSLRGRVAVVAGATRGAGRGIAIALGEAGATVVCTGRSSRAGDRTIRSDYGTRPETIEETAELVTAAGGTGVAIQVDHLDHDAVRALAARIEREHGRLDVLVNDIWGGEGLVGDPSGWDRPMWELDLDAGLRMLRLAVETHLVTSHALLPLLASREGGLVVEMTDGTVEYNRDHYRISVFYDLAKTAVGRLGFSQAHDLRSVGGTALSVTPGWLRSELMLEHFGVREANWRDALEGRDGAEPAAPADFEQSESPRFVGRGIAALAADPDRQRWTGRSATATDLARAYGVVDVDGRVPDVWPLVLAADG
ncbi:SDR family NAD(P)-dependent oxidoreductase [Pseudoclavibacter chungangensis]|uniref:SDR family NAD(P)-dependent oxidoreductase n=1 Tax=Pseudoclavibacter chungangensis TaxID=587635 RepID=A0A7J5C3L5_9MICO|nr:SDR family NAD(P)-dependent oxidoreductase [Pseudoclavibacter chungangensis]